MGIDKTVLEKTLYHGMIGMASAGSLIVESEIEMLKVIPSRVELIGFEVEMMEADGKERALKRLISEVENIFDYIILDCPPSLSLLTVNAMTAAKSLLIPLQCEFYALEGLGQLLQTIKRIKQSLNPTLSIAGILLTMFDKRTNLSHQVAQDAQKYFNSLVYTTKIPRNVKLGEAPSFGKPVLFYDPASVGAISYIDLATEILNSA
jgi:chromosome partitioning protein